MEEENKDKKDTNGSLENNHKKDSSSKSSFFNNLREASSNNFNNYKSRSNHGLNIPNKNYLNKSFFPTAKKNNALTGKQNNISNQLLNKVTNAHPALKTLSVINDMNNFRKNRKADKDDNITDTTSSDTNSVDVDDTNEKKSVSSILDSNKNFKGKFSLMGKISLKTKVILFSTLALFGFLFLILIPLFIIGMFTGLFGLEDSSLTGGGNTGNISYGDYVLSSDGHSILHESLDSFLGNKGSSLENFNSLIKSNVNKAGYGTRAGVVAAAVTLIAELGNNYQVKLPYFYGGGHGQIVEGAASNWGSRGCHTNANGISYNYCGMDCSGFAVWAIYNGGLNIRAISTGNFKNLPGAKSVTLTDSALLQPGDLLESTYHVAVVVKVETDGYICAEASGNTSGILFTKRAFKKSNYWGVKMDGFYDTQVRG